ncbi:MAG: cell division protein FtsL [Clostridia bacterium]|nr:cell division protein FtsL [Clostridia bacterium]
MASYGYQYGTSARKLEPEVRTPKKSSKKVAKTKQVKKTKEIKSKQYKDKVKSQEAKVARTNFAILMMIALGCILLLMYRNVKIRESFAGVQSLSKTVSAIEKENSQIAVNIQNNLNLNNIESIAASSLGMQKLSSKQTVYINLDTKDYTEISQKSIIKEAKPSLFQRIVDWAVDFF